MVAFYMYEILYWCPVEQAKLKERGFVQAETYSEAAQKIAHDFGEDNIVNLQINFMECTDGNQTLPLRYVLEALGE